MQNIFFTNNIFTLEFQWQDKTYLCISESTKEYKIIFLLLFIINKHLFLIINKEC